MCGIIGYTGRRQAAPVLLDGLKRLEYRGYDSAGIALVRGTGFFVRKKKGRVEELSETASERGTVGIGHTRWATHGEPSERNAHPHVCGKFALVHNGIVENGFRLRKELEETGEIFSSDTDSETVVRLLNRLYDGDVLAALKKTAERLEGSYALAILCTDFPDEIFCARRASPLIVGVGAGECYAVSDPVAVAGREGKFYALSDGEFARLSPDGATVYDRYLRPVAKEEKQYGRAEVPQLGTFRHFMRKEMEEIPDAIENSLLKFIDEPLKNLMRRTKSVSIVACGTAYHSGVAAKTAIEALARIPVEVCAASEYRYGNPVSGEGTLVLAVSQSGETADTIAAARLAKERGASVVAVTNVADSTLTTAADLTLYTYAGREIGVAATKSYNAQLALLYSFAVALAQGKGREELPYSALTELPALAKRALRACDGVRSWAQRFQNARSVFFIGRGSDYAAALEGSLKLKELSYLPSEGYAAGELKHGTLALIDRNTPVVALLTNREIAEKTMNAVHEAYARGARVFLVTSLPEYALRKEVSASVVVPETDPLFSPALSVIPLQALAYYTALACGNDPDKPRNLAKSVTVE
ncbi:MAG: glutamine--fructose-6-phosphate transaminase (isomerizing) [Candidatus Gallimonas sp.]